MPRALIRNSHLKGMFDRLVANSGLALLLDVDGYGYSIYLDDTTKQGAKLKTLSFGSSKSEIYYQMLAANQIIEEMRLQSNANEHDREHNNQYNLFLLDDR